MAPCPSGTVPYTVQAGDSLWSIAQRMGTDTTTIMNLNPQITDSIIYIGQTLCLPGSAGPHGGTVVSESGLMKQMRMLWEQHVFWTRLFIVSTVFNLPDASAVTSRLLRNPKDFAAALRPFYGDAAASGFSDLLTTHLTQAGQLVKAAMANDTAAAAQIERQWYQNADEIAASLARLNPHWPREEWRRLLHDHLAMTKQEAVDYITKDFAGSVATFDRIEKEALEMADLMSTGIIQQFPRFFVA
jgi:LysM repeat protein